MRALAAFLVCLVALVATARAEPVFEFLYVEANEGDSSGGHAALRLGDEVFHFQYHAGRLLRLERDEWPHFRHVYGRLGNRRIHVRRVAATPGSGTLLREAFAVRLLEEDAQARFLAALETDRALLMALDATDSPGEAAAAVLPVEGAGYFSASATEIEPSLAALRARLSERGDPATLARRIAVTGEEIQTLRPTAGGDAWLARAEVAPLALPLTFSERIANALARHRALEIIATAPVLAPDGFHAPWDETFRLDDAERRALAREADRLENRLVDLVWSPRADAGRVLLVGLARLAALSRSLESGRLVFLDAFPEDAMRVSTKRAPAQPEVVAALREDARAAFSAARTGLVWSEDPGEAELSALETAANRLYELESATAEGRSMRLASGPLVPSRSAVLAAPPLPALPRAERTAALAEAASRSEVFEGRFRALHGYDLLTQNCVTELFRGIDAAFAAAGEDPVTASQTRLGGWVDAGAFARFIPFVADAAVARGWRLESSRILPSERENRLADMKEREPGWVVELRESNTVTSSVYRLHGGDSFFLFFSDGSVLSRPLLGALNLAAGITQSAAGLALLPFDGGETLSNGAMGALFSVPELLFVSLRKGTLDWVPPRPGLDEAPADALAQDGP